MDKERYQTQVAQSITPLVSSTYSWSLSHGRETESFEMDIGGSDS